MKKHTFIYLCLIVAILSAALTLLGFYLHSRYCLKHFFEDWKSETNQKMIQVVYPDLLYDKEQNILFDLGEILEVEQKHGFVEDVYCVRNSRIYFCYSTHTNSTLYDEWHIASVSVDGDDFQEHFHNTEDPTKGQYEQLAYADQNERAVGGLYHNGKIFLRGETKIFAYDIDTDTVADAENLPTLEHSFTISKDNQQLLIENTKTNERRTVTLQSMAKTNAYVNQLLRLHSGEALDYFFADAVSIDGEIYIICSVVGFFRTFSLTFQYDFANDEVKFVSLLQMYDSTHASYSIVPFLK